MRPDGIVATARGIGLYRVPDRRSIWQWADENVSFGRAYPTARPGRYSSDYLPFWREPMEAATDPTVREVVVLKCAQAGGTENLLLNALRHAVAVRPTPTMYCGGTQELTEAFMEERIKPSLLTASACAEQMRVARLRGTEIHFPDMLLAVTWASSVAGLKSRPIGLVLADELSIWPEDAMDKLRQRASTYPGAHLLVISAPDAMDGRSSDDDPIFREYGSTDRREYELPDPAGGWFRFVMGGPTSVEGLHWDEDARNADGTWDAAKVRSSAHYVTAAGTRIEDRDRMALVARGRWVPTNPAADSRRRGYRIAAFLLPWCSFGDLATDFLRAKERGKAALRVFIYERLAERWADEVEAARDDAIYARVGEYQRGIT